VKIWNFQFTAKSEWQGGCFFGGEFLPFCDLKKKSDFSIYIYKRFFNEKNDLSLPDFQRKKLQIVSFQE
jgi:hypothetical protein